jgi:hypothetical protein
MNFEKPKVKRKVSDREKETHREIERPKDREIENELFLF